MRGGGGRLTSYQQLSHSRCESTTEPVQPTSSESSVHSRLSNLKGSSRSTTSRLRGDPSWPSHAISEVKDHLRGHKSPLSPKGSDVCFAVERKPFLSFVGRACATFVLYCACLFGSVELAGNPATSYQRYGYYLRQVQLPTIWLLHNYQTCLEILRS